MKKYKVTLSTKVISLEWWGQQWCSNISNYADYYNRLERGRAYVRKGAVGEITVDSGHISAEVKGTRPEPYLVDIYIDPVTDTTAENALKQIQDIDSLGAGKLPGDYKSLFSVDEGLFPKPSEIKFMCSCPDVAVMCKHVASVLYAVGSILDSEPLLLFELRGIDIENHLNTQLRSATNKLLIEINSHDKGSNIISDDMISDLFNIEIETNYTAPETTDKNDTEHETVTEIKVDPSKIDPKELKTDSLKRKNPSSIHSKYAPDEKPLSGFVIRQYSLDGIFIAEYASYIEADKYTNAGILNIKRACKKIIKGAGGYQWRIVKENSPASNIESMKPIVLDGMTGAILCSNMKGTFIQHFKSIEQASSYTGVDPKLIKEALDGVHTFAGGYIWERV